MTRTSALRPRIAALLAVSLVTALLAAGAVTPPSADAAPAEGAGPLERIGTVTPLSGPTAQVERRIASTTSVHRAFRGSAPEPSSVIGKDTRALIDDTTAYPARTIGQIELWFGLEHYICTGWLIDANSVLTSGHCAYLPTPSGDAIIDAATFYPGRNGAVDPYGSCDVAGAYAPEAWRVNGSAANDWALLQLEASCTIGETTGWLGMFALDRDDALEDIRARLHGYPSDMPPGTQWVSRGKIWKSEKTKVFYAMDTFGGQSGSPVFEPNRDTCGGPCGMAVHSYGVAGGTGKGAYNMGPRITKARLATILGLMDDNDP